MNFNIPFIIKKEKEKLIEEQLQLEIETYHIPKENYKEDEEKIVIIEIL